LPGSRISSLAKLVCNALGRRMGLLVTGAQGQMVVWCNAFGY
jgi:hypothetical protein